jgi:lambda repressor-like predicted transcriptional regulator
MIRRLLEEAGVRTHDETCLGMAADELAATVAARYAAGVSVERLSRDTGLDRRQLNDLIHQHHIPIRTRRPLPADQIPWVITQYQHGATLRTLATLTGRSHSTIRRTLLTSGITPRNRNSQRKKRDRGDHPVQP